MFLGDMDQKELDRRCHVCGRLSINPISMSDKFAQISGLAEFKISFPPHTGFEPQFYKLCHKCSKVLLTYLNHMKQLELQKRKVGYDNNNNNNNSSRNRIS